MFGDGRTEGIDRLVQIVGAMKNGNIELVHTEKGHESTFDRIVSPENLFEAWEEFRRGKRRRQDVQRFEWNVEREILLLQRELSSGSYRHGAYSTFTVQDPKQRRIHKAEVRDRLVHHAVVRVLEPLFDRRFIAHSYACRRGKGTHKAVNDVHRMLRKVGRNSTRSCFALQCDIHRFFASVDHSILLSLLGKVIKDDGTMQLVAEIVRSHRSPEATWQACGLPIGNLTSQLFANVYLHELDQFVKHDLSNRWYARYSDDFILVSSDQVFLHRQLCVLQMFLADRLRLQLHPRKIRLRPFHQGVDFLGYVLFPHHRVVRTRARRRMQRMVSERVTEWHAGLRSHESAEKSLQSYLGVLSHANSYRLREEIVNEYWFWQRVS